MRRSGNVCIARGMPGNVEEFSQTRSMTPFYSFLDVRACTSVWVKNFRKVCGQTACTIVTKLRTVTQGVGPGVIGGILVLESSARGHLSCEIISRLALWRKFDKFNFPEASRSDLEKCPLQT